jgi:hypothetical protein
MKKVNSLKRFKSGFLYFIEDYKFTKDFDFEKEIRNVKKDCEISYELQRINLLPVNNEIPEKLMFEVDDTVSDFGFSFSGFLHPNGEILGKFKWNQGSGLADEHFKGNYMKVGTKKILVFGRWNEEKVTDFVCIEIVS